MKESRKLVWAIGSCAIFAWSTFFLLLAIPGEVRNIDRMMLCECMTTEHGWPLVWLDKQLVQATTTVRPSSENWTHAKEVAQKQFDKRYNEKSVLRFAEMETNFSPQYSPPMAASFWSRWEAYPWFQGDEVFFKVRWIGLFLDLAIWVFGSVAILFCFRFIKFRRVSFTQLSIRVSLALLALACTWLAGYAFYDRARNREQEVVRSLQSEPAIGIDFVSSVPIWLDRLTDYRLRHVWATNSFQRGVKVDSVTDMGLFDRISAIRLSNYSSAGPTSLKDPVMVARGINELSKLEFIWVDCKDSQEVDALLAKIDGGSIRFISMCSSFRFDSKKTKITHYLNLEGLYIENAGHIEPGFVSSFPKLKSLRINPDSIDNQVIDEILALKDLSQLGITNTHGKILSEKQMKRLEDELLPRSVRLYIRP